MAAHAIRTFSLTAQLHYYSKHSYNKAKIAYGPETGCVTYLPNWSSLQHSHTVTVKRRVIETSSNDHGLEMPSNYPAPDASGTGRGIGFDRFLCFSLFFFGQQDYE